MGFGSETQVPLSLTVHQIVARTWIYTTQEAAFRTPLVLLRIVFRKGSKVAFQWNAHFSAMRNAWHHHLWLPVAPYISTLRQHHFVFVLEVSFPVVISSCTQTVMLYMTVITDKTACVCSLLLSLRVLLPSLRDCSPAIFFKTWSPPPLFVWKFWSHNLSIFDITTIAHLVCRYIGNPYLEVV